MENFLIGTILVFFTIGVVFAVIGIAFVTSYIIDELKKRKK
jgi:hypothetical protein